MGQLIGEVSLYDKSPCLDVMSVEEKNGQWFTVVFDENPNFDYRCGACPIIKI